LLQSIRLMEYLSSFDGILHMDAYSGDVLKKIDALQAKVLLPLKGKPRKGWEKALRTVRFDILTTIRESLKDKVDRAITNAEWKAKSEFWDKRYPKTPVWTKTVTEMLDAFWSRFDPALAMVSALLCTVIGLLNVYLGELRLFVASTLLSSCA
jgi:hypothetical protein